MFHFSDDRLQRLALLLSVMLSAVGCASFVDKGNVTVSMTVSRPKYDLGEAVVATVEVKNDTTAPIMVPALDSRSITFYAANPDNTVPAKCQPVQAKSVEVEPREVPPAGVTSRPFVFTGLTDKPGKRAMMAAVSGCASANGKVDFSEPQYSQPAPFEVTQNLKFKRDPYSGIITNEHAIDLARASAKIDPQEQARAVLVPLDDAGLVEWVVFFGGPQAAEEASTAYVVNPYVGSVKVLDMNSVPKQGGGSK